MCNTRNLLSPFHILPQLFQPFHCLFIVNISVVHVDVNTFVSTECSLIVKETPTSNIPRKPIRFHKKQNVKQTPLVGVYCVYIFVPFLFVIAGGRQLHGFVSVWYAPFFPARSKFDTLSINREVKVVDTICIICVIMFLGADRYITFTVAL